jgi:hypothetical protein
VSASTQKLKPSDCVLAFGIPICEGEFWEAREDPLRDFVKNQIWEQYDFQFVSHLRKIEPCLVKLGSKIVPRLTLQDFGRLFGDPSNKVIILFSHWTHDTVEFFDGMATEDEIISVIPSSFEGIVDLTICHPNRLPVRIRNHLPPTALVKYTDVENTPTIWLYFYWALFTILNDSNNSDPGNSGSSYLEALEKTVEEFKK